MKMDASAGGGSARLEERLAGGDREALGALLRRYLPGLRGYVGLKLDPLLRARESESDILQSTCREVLEHLERYRFPSEDGFRRWLHATSLRKIRNRYRFYLRDKRDAQREVRPRDGSEASSRELPDPRGSRCTPLHELVQREEIARIEAAVERLPASYREALRQVRLVGRPRAQVALGMGRSDAAFRTLLCRAQARLVEILAESGGTD